MSGKERREKWLTKVADAVGEMPTGMLATSGKPREVVNLSEYRSKLWYPGKEGKVDPRHPAEGQAEHCDLCRQRVAQAAGRLLDDFKKTYPAIVETLQKTVCGGETEEEKLVHAALAAVDDNPTGGVHLRASRRPQDK
jgi:hypothetical protein